MRVDLGPWERCERDRLAEMVARGTYAPGLRLYQREVEDGHLTAMAACEANPRWEGPRWHLSISHRTNDHPPRPGRYPTWDEVGDARYRFIPDSVTMAMLLPPQAEYVNEMETCFHLWQV